MHKAEVYHKLVIQLLPILLLTEFPEYLKRSLPLDIPKQPICNPIAKHKFPYWMIIKAIVEEI
jgi:hypothetical protein